MTVTRADLEARLAQLRREVEDPRAGIYGPGSMAWEIDKEAVLFLGGGRAALLQLAHPFVAHAVEQHSVTRTDLVGRFRRTFVNVFAMVFGDLDHAIGSARRVYAVHEKIHGRLTEDVGPFSAGTRYEANAEDALLWVHATLLDTSVQIYERCVRRLSPGEKARFYAETRRFAWLFGIPDDVLPASWPDFEAYMARMFDSPVLTVGRPASEMARFLLLPPTPAHAPVMHWYRMITAGLLPERLRGEFGFSFGRADELWLRASLGAIRGAHRTLPRRLRYMPAYVEARRRLAGKPGPDRVGRMLEKIALRGIDPRAGARRAPPRHPA